MRARQRSRPSRLLAARFSQCQVSATADIGAPKLTDRPQSEAVNGVAVLLKGVEVTPAVKRLLEEVTASGAAAGAKLPQLLAAVEASP